MLTSQLYCFSSRRLRLRRSLAATAPAASGGPSIRPWMCSGRPAPGAVPLRVHGHYSRAENEAAFGVLSTESPWIHREGVLCHQPSATVLLFITLRKSEALFSPSSRYRELALGPALFHWESQSTTTAASPTGQCTIHHASRGSRASPAAWLPGCCLALQRRWRFETRQTGLKGLRHTMSYRIRLLETEEGWAVSCLDLPGCHSQGESRDEALENIREAIALWLEVEAEEAGVKSVETLELAL